MSITLTAVTIEQLKTKWPELQKTLQVPHPFVTAEWLQAWWESFGGEDDLFMGEVADNNVTIGIAPLRIHEEVARFVGSADVCDYLDFLIKSGAENDFFGVLLGELKARGVKTLELESIRPDSTVLKYLAPLARSKGFAVDIGDADVTLEMPLPSTWDVYLSSLATHQRHETGRKMRRLEEAGNIRFDITIHDDVNEELSKLIRLLRISRSDKAEFMSEKMESYFKTLASAMKGAGLLRFGHLRLDETIVASVMCFDYNETRYLYNSGYDPQYSTLSVGLLSKLYSIKDAIEHKMRRYDFLKGAETYKYHLGGIEKPITRVRIELT